MKLNNLFESALPNDFTPKRMTQYKDLAKSLELTLKMGKGFPGTTAKGAWFGFAIAPMGGSTGEAKGGDERLPFDVRVRAFLKKLAALLEKDMEDGFEIDITDGGEKKLKSKLEPGNAFSQLTQNFKEGYAPGGAYSKFAGKDSGIAGAWFIAPKEAK